MSDKPVHRWPMWLLIIQSGKRKLARIREQEVASPTQKAGRRSMVLRNGRSPRKSNLVLFVRQMRVSVWARKTRMRSARLTLWDGFWRSGWRRALSKRCGSQDFVGAKISSFVYYLWLRALLHKLRLVERTQREREREGQWAAGIVRTPVISEWA